MTPRPDAMRPRARPRPERVRPRLRPNDLASRPHGPRGLNIPAASTPLACRLSAPGTPHLRVRRLPCAP